MSYPINLAARLAIGTADWPESFIRRHAAFLAGARQPDGGFAGRQGTDDLYYTSFGLQGLALLGALDKPIAERVGIFLKSKLDGTLSSIELYSLVFSAALLNTSQELDLLDDIHRTKFLTAIDTYQHADGGYAKSGNNPSGSTYHTFLAVLCKQLLEFPRVDKPPLAPTKSLTTQSIVEFIRSRQRDDGGFVEIPRMRASGTNPTCAAVVLLKQLGRLDDTTQKQASEFLSRMQNEEGGFRANTQIPVADLLSTFTALATLAELGTITHIDRAAAADYARRLEQPGGGFCGGAWDDTADVEYTFYGLGTLALTASG